MGVYRLEPLRSTNPVLISASWLRDADTPCSQSYESGRVVDVGALAWLVGVLPVYRCRPWHEGP